MGDGGRLATGWRHDVVGEPIRALAAGEASLAVDGQGRLRSKPAPGCPWSSDGVRDSEEAALW